MTTPTSPATPLTDAVSQQRGARWLSLRVLPELLPLPEAVSRGLRDLASLRMARSLGDLARPEVAAALGRQLARGGDAAALEATLVAALRAHHGALNPPPPQLAPGLSAAALASWAHAHHVGHWLVAPAEAALPGLPSWVGRGDTLAALLAAPESGQAWSLAQGAALALLADRADAAARGAAAHAARASGRGEADAPALSPLVTTLTDARAAFAAQSWLRPRPADELGKARLRVTTSPPGLRWRLPTSVANACCAGPEVSLSRGPEGRWRLACRCQAAGAGPSSAVCEARVEAVERMLDLLTRPGGAPQRKQRRTLAAAVGAAPWQRELDAFLDAAGLDLAKKPGTPRVAKGRFVWRAILRRGRLWEIAPALATPRPAGGLALAGLRLDAAARELAARPSDRALLPLIEAARALRGEGQARPLWRHVLTSLVGADHVVVDGRAVTPARVERRRVGLSLARRADRCVVLATLDGGPLVPDEADAPPGHGDAPAERASAQADPADLRATAALVDVLRLEAGVYWDAGRACIDVLDASPAVRRTLQAAVDAGGAFPLAALGDLRSRLAQGLAAEPDALHVAASAQGATEQTDPRPWLRLAVREGRAGRWALHAALVVRPLAGSATRTPGGGPRLAWTLRGATPLHGERDLVDERERAAALWRALDLPAMPDDDDAPDAADVNPWAWLEEDPDRALDLVARAQLVLARVAAEDPRSTREADDPALIPTPAPDPSALLAGVFWDSRPLAVVGRAAPQGLRVELHDKRDWFALRGSWRAAGNAEVAATEHTLDALLTALREGRRYVEVAKGDWVEIDAALRERLLTPALQRGQLSPLTAPDLTSLAQLGVQVAGPARWMQLHERVRAAAALSPPPPSTLHATLRPYQRAGFQWLARLSHWAPGAVLADDMGLGKTVQALALLLHRTGSGPQLVVAPTSVLGNWQREVTRFAPGLAVTEVRGQADLDRLPASTPGEGAGPTATVVLTTWDALGRHGPRFAAPRWTTVVFDEAQAVKNPRTQRTRAAVSLQADFRLALTGTPMENHAGELWSLLRVTVPGLLSGERDFRARFRVPIERYGDERARAALGTLIRPFVLRRLKSEVAQELPPRQEVRLEVDLDPVTQRRYDTLRASLKAQLGKKRRPDGGARRVQVLAALTRLRQLACHPALLDPTSQTPAAKVQALRGHLAELRAEGHQALVFSQFTALLDLVRPALEADGLRTMQLDGRTPGKRRQALVDAFQGGAADVFLISLKAGGTGLNLTAASYVFHLDPWWNPAAEDQATDRAHRIGQDRPVTVYRLVTRGTVEEAIFDLHRHKRDLVSGLLSGATQGGDEGRSLRVQDLETLVLYSGKRTWEARPSALSHGVAVGTAPVDGSAG